jgi:NAD(P)-dependent dehydrogenase (short-subunit alcohol dehydrogenase family)
VLTSGLTIIAPPGSLAETIGRMVEAGNDFAIPVAIVDAMPSARAAPLAGLSDADFEAGCITPLADLAAVIAGLLPGHRHVVLVGSSAGLGDWDAAVHAAFAAGATGLMRSAALEYAGEGVSLNMIALPSGDQADLRGAAAVAAGLLASGAVSGQVIPCDGGANLKMRAARPRGPAALPGVG